MRAVFGVLGFRCCLLELFRSSLVNLHSYVFGAHWLCTRIGNRWFSRLSPATAVIVRFRFMIRDFTWSVTVSDSVRHTISPRGSYPTLPCRGASNAPPPCPLYTLRDHRMPHDLDRIIAIHGNGEPTYVLLPSEMMHGD